MFASAGVVGKRYSNAVTPQRFVAAAHGAVVCLVRCSSKYPVSFGAMLFLCWPVGGV